MCKKDTNHTKSKWVSFYGHYWLMCHSSLSSIVDGGCQPWCNDEVTFWSNKKYIVRVNSFWPGCRPWLSMYLIQFSYSYTMLLILNLMLRLYRYQSGITRKWRNMIHKNKCNFKFMIMTTQNNSPKKHFKLCRPGVLQFLIWLYFFSI